MIIVKYNIKQKQSRVKMIVKIAHQGHEHLAALLRLVCFRYVWQLETRMIVNVFLANKWKTSGGLLSYLKHMYNDQKWVLTFKS